MEDSNPEVESLCPPSTSGKSDAELLREHGISKHCMVCLNRIGRFLLEKKKEPNKVFKVHYGNHFLQEIADYAFRPTLDYTAVDFDKLYSTYITSQFSALDRVRFKSIVQSYHAQWQNDFNRRRADLIAKKVAEVNAKRRAALKKRKICYKNSFVIVNDGISEEVRKALRNGQRSKVVLERIFMDGPISEKDTPHTSGDDAPHTPGDDAPRISGDDASGDNAPHASGDDAHQSSVSQSETGTESNDSARTEEAEDLDDPRTVTKKLVWDLIEKTSQEFERTGFCEFVEEDNNNTRESSGQATDDCCDSDDTIESPMEVEFGSGESPDFSKVLRISHQEEFGDSEETCHGDEFVTQSRSSYMCDTDQSNSGLPTENGDGKHDGDIANNSSDEGNNCVIKLAIRNQNKSIVAMKLCN